MKNLKKTFVAMMLLPATMLFATTVKIAEAGELPTNCQTVGEVKVGDIAAGHRIRTDVIEEVKREAVTLGGNYVLVDVKRVNHPKQGVYYWGWGTVGLCK